MTCEAMEWSFKPRMQVTGKQYRMFPGIPSYFFTHREQIFYISSSWVCVLSHSVMSDCDTLDCSPQGASFLGVLWARMLEWVAISSSRESSRPRDQTHVSCVSCIGRQIFTIVPPGKPHINRSVPRNLAERLRVCKRD